MAGLASAAAALATGEVLAALLAPAPSLVRSVGQEVINRVPPAVEDLAISAFGRNDKRALVVGIVLVCLALGAALGAAAARRWAVGVAGFCLFALVGLAAAVSQAPGTFLVSALAATGGVAAGLYCLRHLLASRPPDVVPVAAPVEEDADAGRRGFLRLAATVAGVAVVAGVAGRSVARALMSGAKPSQITLSPVAAPLPTPMAAMSLPVDGVSPLFTPNADFYRIDTALVVPRVDLENWRLEVNGMVDRPLVLSFDDLLAMPQTEADVTLSCVSNEVGGDLVGNARWRGVRLVDLLDRAGVQEGADQIVGRSVDGWTGGFPTDAAIDGREALVAVGMNDEPLPLEHGFPARLVVPGLYGYVSATKWLSQIELTTLGSFDGYWVPRGWSKRGPVKTESRIDVPRFGARLPLGRQPIAGVAWAPTRGIARVEVSIDDGAWTDAVLSEPLSDASWRQWSLAWDASSGRHQVRVRATDGTGATQTEERTSPRPDGATGFHTIAVTVAEAV
ncbi:MAG: molybdopterin-dependent oxidoreductase [Acidimicrobiales bacterium]